MTQPAATVVPGSEARPAPAHGVTMHGILPEHPVAKNGFVEVGHLRVEASAYGKFREAMLFEAKNPETTTIAKSLIDGPKTTTVTTNGKNENFMQPKTNGDAEVHWDPTKMNVSSNGALRSPATRLGHELDHADEWTHHPDRLKQNAAVKDTAYTNDEEKRVISGWERRTTPLLGEGQRDSHYSKGSFEARGVTSHEAVLHATRDGKTAPLPEGYRQDGKIVRITPTEVVQSVGRGEVSYPTKELGAFVDLKALQAAQTAGTSMQIGVSHGAFTQREAPTQQHSQQLSH